MQFAKLFVIGSSFVVATLAQGRIAFTTLPASVRAGEATNLEWTGGDSDAPVTLTLKQGDPDNLETVAIITGDATGNSYTWTPSQSLPDADNYALQISQGVNDINYTGQFSLSGGSSASASATSTSSSSSSSITSAATLSSAVASLNNTVSSLVASVSNATANATTTQFIAAGTGAVASGGSSAATGTVMNRNTTMSSPTLSSTRTSTADSSSTTDSEETSGASTSSAAESAPSSDAMQMASPLAFVLSAFVAIVYLG